MQTGLYSGIGYTLNSFPSTYTTLSAAIASESLTTNLGVSVDFEALSGGNFTNEGSDGGTLDANGSPSYRQAFPNPVGGYAVGFPTTNTDGFSASATTIGDPGSSDFTVFCVFSCTTPGTSNIVSKKISTTENGFELRISNTGTIVCVIENDSAVQRTLTLADAGHIDGTPHYVYMTIDNTNGNLYMGSDLVAETTTASVSGSYTANTALAIGKDIRNAMANGLVRSLAIWKGRNDLRESQIASLFTAMGG